MNASDKSPVETHALRLAESLRSRSTSQVVLECLIHGCISSTALIGNLFVLYVVYKSSRLRNVTGLFVVSLAMSDIAMATLVAPQSFAALVAGRWTSGFIACQLQGFVVIATVTASLQTMSLMSIDRYFRVVRPMKHRSFFTMPRARVMAASVWILSLMYPVPYVNLTGRNIKSVFSLRSLASSRRSVSLSFSRFLSPCFSLFFRALFSALRLTN